ncbi:MAG: FAD-binding oxidoreductase, partial [Thermoanaerobaculia bacterium]|nr:FAD-binding oxidoreductase [Thermoanaerobaculia bacterium]
YRPEAHRLAPWNRWPRRLRLPQLLRLRAAGCETASVTADTNHRLSGWGRLSVPGREVCPENLVEGTTGATLSRGLGRSYGDASLPPEGVTQVVGTRRADRILHFDEDSGWLRAEAGLTLRTLNRLLIPRGWFTPVSPGTQEVTLGGMVAADVHGKNHHVAGTFGRHVGEVTLRTGSGRVQTCSREVEPALFLATLGGMGLTGHILEVSVQLQKISSAWIDRESVRTHNLEESITTLMELGVRWPYTVAWIDCLLGGASMGRGIVEGGHWVASDVAPSQSPSPKRVRDVPVFAPNFLLNRFSLGLYNRFRYWRHGRGTRRQVVSYEEFFYPLDALGEWSRLYGRRGMTQYQCVLPREAGDDAVRAVLEEVHRAGGAPFLVVLKDLGDEGEGLLSFPRSGFTLAIDFAVSSETVNLVFRLDELVLDRGGRIYLAKDMFTTSEHFESMERERLPAFDAVLRRWDPQGTIRSRQWERLRSGGSAG